MFSPFFRPDCSCDIYLKTRDGRTAREQLETLMSPPLWPVPPGALRASLTFHDVPPSFDIGGIRVDTMEVPHPGGATAYRLSWRETSVVYATDAELLSEDVPAFCRFAGGCGLLLLDAQYSEAEYRVSRGFGHMPVDWAAEVARRCGARQTVLVHHAPMRTDEQLLAWDQALRQKMAAIRFGRAGDELTVEPMRTDLQG